MNSPLGMYQPGDTVWHRLGAGTKLVGLLVISTATVVVRGPAPSVVLLLAALTVCLWAGMRLPQIFASIRMLLIMLAALMVWHVWSNGWARAVEATFDLLGLVLLTGDPSDPHHTGDRPADSGRGRRPWPRTRPASPSGAPGDPGRRQRPSHRRSARSARRRRRLRSRARLCR